MFITTALNFLSAKSNMWAFSKTVSIGFLFPEYKSHFTFLCMLYFLLLLLKTGILDNIAALYGDLYQKTVVAASVCLFYFIFVTRLVLIYGTCLPCRVLWGFLKANLRHLSYHFTQNSQQDFPPLMCKELLPSPVFVAQESV